MAPKESIERISVSGFFAKRTTRSGPLSVHSKIVGRFQKLKLLRHRHLCRYLEISRGRRGRLNIIAEHHGRPLRTELSDTAGRFGNTGLSETRICALVQQIVLALVYLNANSVVCSNLSPDNILVDKQGTIKLSNYGLSLITGQGAFVSFALGRPEYASPEVIAAGPTFHAVGPHSSKADVWSLGIIIVELLTGDRPFHDKTSSAALGNAPFEVFSRMLSALCGHVTPPPWTDLKEGSLRDRLRLNNADTTDETQHRNFTASVTARVERWLASVLPTTTSTILRDFIASCLMIDVVQRPEPQTLLDHPFLSSPHHTGVLPRQESIRTQPREQGSWVMKPHLVCMTLQPRAWWGTQTSSETVVHTPSKKAKEEERVQEVVGRLLKADIVSSLWRLCKGDPDQVLCNLGDPTATPAIYNMPKGIIRSVSADTGYSSDEDEGIANRVTEPSSRLYDDKEVLVDLQRLRLRLNQQPKSPAARPPTTSSRINKLDLEDEDDDWTLVPSLGDALDSSTTPNPNKDPAAATPTSSSYVMDDSWITAKMVPLSDKESSLEYQLARLQKFHGLLNLYPTTQAELFREAKADIPPCLRADVWAVLLGVRNVEAVYDKVNRDEEGPSDHQIDVDIPRCHQYHELLSSPEGHQKLRRVLKAWVIANPSLVYWQGLDSLAAPFIVINFNYEARAFCCLQALVERNLKDFFLPDNASVLRAYLRSFTTLLAFHDPLLASHMASIGFLPELFAISWFITLFAHVLPIDQILRLWDTILLTPPAFPLFLAVAILGQLRDRFLTLDFNSAITFFSSLANIDVDAAVREGVICMLRTPESVIPHTHRAQPAEADPMDLSPRITSLPSAGGCFIVDIRPIPDRNYAERSIYLPVTDVVEELSTEASSVLASCRGTFTVIVGETTKHAAMFASVLVRSGFPYVAVLDVQK